MPTIDSSTIRSASTRAAAACSCSPAAVKNAVAFASSVVRTLLTSMMRCTPASARSRPAPVVRSTPLSLDTTTTSTSVVTNASTT